MSSVQTKAHLLLASPAPEEPDTVSIPQVVLIGEVREVELGEKLWAIHVRNQIEMQRFHDQRDQLLQRLNERRKWQNIPYEEVFTIEAALLSKIIGMRGENVQFVRERHGVDIALPDMKRPAAEIASGITASALSQSTTTKVIIRGESAEAVRKAREELEYVNVTIPLESDRVAWILGRGYHTIKDIARKTELHYA